MSYYETLFIVHPALEAGRLKDIILSFDESLKKDDGKTLSIDVWGKKRLAYLIEKQKYGTYVKFQFSGEGSCAKKLEMELQHNSNILSYLTTTISESDISEQENDLDTQIAGQSRENRASDEKVVAKNENSDIKKNEEEKVEDENNSKSENSTDELEATLTEESKDDVNIMENEEEKVEDENNSKSENLTDELEATLTEESKDDVNIIENEEEVSIDKEKE